MVFCCAVVCASWICKRHLNRKQHQIIFATLFRNREFTRIVDSNCIKFQSRGESKTMGFGVPASTSYVFTPSFLSLFASIRGSKCPFSDACKGGEDPVKGSYCRLQLTPLMIACALQLSLSPKNFAHRRFIIAGFTTGKRGQ